MRTGHRLLMLVTRELMVSFSKIGHQKKAVSWSLGYVEFELPVHIQVMFSRQWTQSQELRRKTWIHQSSWS